MLAIYVGLALAYNVIQPPFEMSDEREHFDYVLYLLEQRAVPVFVTGQVSEYHQPPLYYLVGALLAWPFPAADRDMYLRNPYAGFRHWELGADNKNLYLHGPWDQWPFRGTALTVHVARLASLLFGVVTVTAAFHVARSLLDERRALAVMGLVAFTPMFVSVSGSVQNDAGAAALGTGLLWLAVRCYDTGYSLKRAFLLGVLAGLGGLMKLTAAMLFFPAAALMLFWLRAQRASGRQAGGFFLSLAVGAFIGGWWWYGRNWLIFGEPTSLSANLATYASHSPLTGFAWWGDGLGYAWTTYWMRIGMGDLHMPDWVYQLLTVPVLAGAAGLMRHWLTAPAGERAKVVAFLISGLVSVAALLGYITFSPTGAQGRYLFPSISALMTLTVLGLTSLAPGRIGRVVTYALPASMLTLAGFVFIGVLMPVYTPPPAISALPAGATQIEAVLSDVAVIRGHQVSQTEAAPGDRVSLTIFWQPLQRTGLPYSVFVHLLDQNNALIAQRDTYPGLGRNPTNAWEPGRLFADTYSVLIPETAPAPATARWRVGLWQVETEDRAWLLGPEGEPIDSGVALGELYLRPRQP